VREGRGGGGGGGGGREERRGMTLERMGSKMI